jgi:hypothetical protein
VQDIEELCARPRLYKPDRLYLQSLPSLHLYKRVATMLIENWIGSIISQKNLPCLPLHHKKVTPMLAVITISVADTVFWRATGGSTIYQRSSGLEGAIIK